MPRGDAISVLEASYDLDVRDADWLARVTEAATAVLAPRGTFGAGGFLFDARDPGQIVMPEFYSAPGSEALMERVRHSQSLLPPDKSLRLARGAVGLSTVLQERLEGEYGAQVAAVGREHGFADSLFLHARDASHRGVTMGWFAPGEVPALSRERLRQGQQLAVHLASGLRLRHRLRELATSPEGEAVLTPDGRLAHATGEATEPSAREALCRAVLAIDRARSGLRRARPTEALSLWQGLVDGRWTLLERVDRDGKRLLLALRNDISPLGPAALSAREQQVLALLALGHSNKLISYDLGLAPSGISALLRSLERKLRVKGRAALVDLALLLRTQPTAELLTLGEIDDRLHLARLPAIRSERLAGLTEAEQDVLHRVMAGESNRTIATQRGTAERTVANQIAALFQKFQVRSRGELTVRLQRGATRHASHR